MAVKELRDGRWIVYGRKGYFPDDPDKTREYFGRNKELAIQRDSILKPAKTKIKKAAGILVYQLCKAYTEDKKSKTEESTQKMLRYKLMLIVGAIGHIEASALTEKQLTRYVNMRREEGVKNTTIRRELSDLKAIFSWAKKKGYLLLNPIAGFELPKLDNEIILPPTDAEIQDLIRHAVPHLVRVIYISALTGLRPGQQELLNMKWFQVDFDKETITVISARKGGLKSRQVPILSLLMTKLIEWRKQDGDQKYIIHYNGAPVKAIKTAWKNTKARAGITRRLRPYDFGHSFASRVLSEGGDLKAVSELLGHSRAVATMRLYQHVTKAVHRASVDKWKGDFTGNTND